MWLREAISDGEVDALYRAAMAACNEDTRYPHWRGSAQNANGECHNIAWWLEERLGGCVGKHKGHYVWLSPDEDYYIDLTGEHGGKWIYAKNERFARVEVVHNERTKRFAQRADRIFDSLDRLLKLGLDYAGDSHPASEPQAEDNSERFNDSWNDSGVQPDQYWHDEPDPTTPEGIYNWFYANGQLEVSPADLHSHNQLADHLGIEPQTHTGPLAAGHVIVEQGKATWECQTNVNMRIMDRILRDATKSYGWRWGGLTNGVGQPVHDDFAPAKAAKIRYYALVGDHLYLGRTSAADLVATQGLSVERGTPVVCGHVEILDDRATVYGAHATVLPHLFDWAQDSGLTLYAGNDNVIKTVPGLGQYDNYNPQTQESPNPVEPPPVDERLPVGLYRCPNPNCQQLFPEFGMYAKHRRDGECAGWGDSDRASPNSDYGLPEGDRDPIYQDGAHFTEMRQEPGITTGSTREGAEYSKRGPLNMCPNCHKVAYQDQAPTAEGPWIGSCHLCGHTGPTNDQNPEALSFDELKQLDDASWARQRARENPDVVQAPAEVDPTWNEFWRGSKVVVLPAQTWKEAARVDGFTRYARAFKYDNDDYTFYVAYRNGDPVGYAAVKPDGYVHMVHSAVENQGVGHAIYTKLTQHFASLYTGASHEKAEKLLIRLGWIPVDRHKWKWSKDAEPKDQIEAPIPFIYDVDEDKIHYGHPGERSSTIPGRFTPGGIVEGVYEPGGKMVIRTMTSIPYTVNHLVALHYALQPWLEVKSVYLEDDAGRATKLANDIVTKLRTQVASDPAAFSAAQALRRMGGKVYVVGGAVRDAVMGNEPKDIDLMVTGLPVENVTQALEQLPGRTDVTGKDFGVYRYRNRGHEVEIALPRSEKSTGQGHQDFLVNADHTMSPEEDLARRDFTANAMALDLSSGQLLDPFGGANDIAQRRLRTTHPESLGEDPLRVVRALVANAKHGLEPDEDTRAQMANHANSLHHLPPERIQPELDKLMSAKDPTRAIRLAHETGTLKHILPEVDAAMGFDQNNPHHELDLGEHLLSVLGRTAAMTTDPDLRLAALLHDIGKPSSAWQDPVTGTNHYYAGQLPDGTPVGANHEEVGSQLARERMSALRYPNDRTHRVGQLVAGHMFPGFSTPRGARKFMSAWDPHVDDLLTLREADQGGKSHHLGSPALNVARQRTLIDQVRAASEPTNVSQLAITGHDLIAAGFQPGPAMGQTLSYLAERVIDDPSLNTPEVLLQLANAFSQTTTEAQDGGPQRAGRRQADPLQEQGVSGAVDASLPHPHAAQQQGTALKTSEAQEPYFPSTDEAIEANQEAYARWAELFGDSPVWGGVLKPNELDSALASAKNHYYYGSEEDEGDRLAQATAKMGWRIAGNQVFQNGNKRTAYWTMREMLDRNGLGHLSPLDYDDTELVDHLVGQDRYGQDRTATDEQRAAEKAQLENEWLELWRNRYNQGGPTEPYEQRYPSGTYITNPEEAAQNPPDASHD